MGSKTNFLESELLDHVLSKATYTAPDTLHIRLYTANPSDSAAGTEVTTGAWTNYAAHAVTNNATNFPAAVNGLKALATAVTFGTAVIPGTAPVVTGMSICDAATAGNILFWSALASSKTITNSDVVTFEANSITFQED